tara:strand:- start:60 stop:473 length:414 start_codon:yes stop_codon:yes gene_type:complete
MRSDVLNKSSNKYNFLAKMASPKLVFAGEANVTLTEAAHCGKIVVMDAASIKATLPDISSTGQNGSKYVIVLAGDYSSVSLDTNSAKFLASCGVSATDDGDKLTCDSAKEGDWIEVTGDGNDWIITGMGGAWSDSGA